MTVAFDHPASSATVQFSWLSATEHAAYTLYDANGKVIGSHYAGPRWETRDGSVVAAARDAGASVDPTAVDWLRLKATSTTDGRLAATSYIQRIHTVGGLAPAAQDCDAGAQLEVPYRADYVFFKKTGR